MIKRAILFLLLVSAYPFVSLASEQPVVLIDKAKFQLHVTNYQEGKFEIVKSYPVTLGKNTGDKVLEGDLKTPEGIYRFTAKFVQPQIKKKLGDMAFYIDYPNSIDRREKKTGYDILLHATDDPARLERQQDSDGCIVMSNDLIADVQNYIFPPTTMVIIYDEMKPEYINGVKSDELKQAFDKWLAAWSGKDIESYINAYAEDFKFQAMNRDQYKSYKGSLNRKYDSINVKADNIRFYNHPKYNVVTFTQEYSATFPGGRPAFMSRGQKRLYFIKEAGQLKIYSEEFSRTF